MTYAHRHLGGGSSRGALVLGLFPDSMDELMENHGKLWENHGKNEVMMVNVG